MAERNYFDPKYFPLSQELFLADRTLAVGLDELVNSNIADHTGRFYSSFFMLAHGLERVAKIALIVDGVNSGKTINARDFGHNLLKLYGHCTELATRLGIERQDWIIDPINKDILDFLSRFAEKARYFNIDKLTSGVHGTMLDPLKEWDTIMQKVIKADLTEAKVAKITHQSNLLSYLLSDTVWGVQHSPSNELLEGAKLFQVPALIKEASPHICWRLIQLIKEYKELLRKLTAISHGKRDRGSKMIVPYMGDFFTFAEYPRSMAIKKKKWR